MAKYFCTYAHQTELDLVNHTEINYKNTKSVFFVVLSWAIGQKLAFDGRNVLQLEHARRTCKNGDHIHCVPSLIPSSHPTISTINTATVHHTTCALDQCGFGKIFIYELP
ncbi:hypothetical protein Fmac_017076 [Flemingia macrophylla]|uniref:Uncharacterized protein n=1 Tax=Flemingia macrophylla TaxID=520843 RepID=A0ABD1M2Y7_9FABA